MQAHQTLVRMDAVASIKAEIVSMGSLVGEFLATSVPGDGYEGAHGFARPKKRYDLTQKCPNSRQDDERLRCAKCQ